MSWYTIAKLYKMTVSSLIPSTKETIRVDWATHVTQIVELLLPLQMESMWLECTHSRTSPTGMSFHLTISPYLQHFENAATRRSLKAKMSTERPYASVAARNVEADIWNTPTCWSLWMRISSTVFSREMCSLRRYCVRVLNALGVWTHQFECRRQYIARKIQYSDLRAGWYLNYAVKLLC
jgi:hypothetical protein